MVFVNIVIQLGYVGNWIAFWLVILLTVVFAFLSTVLIGRACRLYKEKTTSKVVLLHNR